MTMFSEIDKARLKKKGSESSKGCPDLVISLAEILFAATYQLLDLTVNPASLHTPVVLLPQCDRVFLNPAFAADCEKSCGVISEACRPTITAS
jgi:hypothetical protein